MTMRASVPVDEVVEAITTKLRANGYKESTIGVQCRELKRLERWCLEHGGQYTSELGSQFAAMTISPRTGRFSLRRYKSFGRLTRLADSYLATGEVDLAMRKRTNGTKPSPGCERFTRLLADWDRDMNSRNLSAESRYQSREVARRFLLHAQSAGCTSVEQITGSDVLGFLTNLSATLSQASMRTYVAVLRPFLKYTQFESLVSAASIMRFERPRLILGVLTDDETTAVSTTLVSTKIATRDRAVVLLAMTVGLRACDIVGLKLENIDWRGQRIIVNQSKTSNLLVLPLLPAVGNALAQYLLHERPTTNDRHVFVRAKAPHSQLSGHSAIYAIIRRVFTEAGLGPNRSGTRLTRHSAASKMLVGGTPLPTIAAVLGHSQPKSVDRYLEIDVDRLRACVLPLPQAVKP